MTVTLRDIQAAMTVSGGFTRETLAAWGVPWPPPRGWKNELLAHEIANELLARGIAFDCTSGSFGKPPKPPVPD